MNASGDVTLLFLPADIQDPPCLLPKFVELWEDGNEIVYGIRDQREENFFLKWNERCVGDFVSDELSGALLEYDIPYS